MAISATAQQGWTLNGWTVAAGEASCVSLSANLESGSSGFITGKTYLVTFEITSLSAGNISPWIKEPTLRMLFLQ